jgi:replicative DNA helicase
MPDWQWVERMIANVGTISLRNMGKGILTEPERDSLPVTVQTLSAAPIEIFDAIFDLPAIVAKLRQLKAKIPTLAFAVVDYGQLVRVAAKKGQNREQEVAEVSRTLRLLASELNIAMIALSQLNEFGETRESKTLEQDCTAMWKVLEDLDENKQVKRGCENNRTLWVPFQRHGSPNVRVRMTFRGEFMQFKEDEDQTEQELPFDEAEESRANKPRWKKNKRF